MLSACETWGQRISDIILDIAVDITVGCLQSRIATMINIAEIFLVGKFT